jgi:hypothetical protein
VELEAIGVAAPPQSVGVERRREHGLHLSSRDDNDPGRIDPAFAYALATDAAAGGRCDDGRMTILYPSSDASSVYFELPQ